LKQKSDRLHKSHGGLLIAGGGTGGHIYPAIAVAQTLKKMKPDVVVDFVGTTKGLESKIVPRENFPLHFIQIGALNAVGVLTKIMTLLSLPRAILQSMRLILKLKPKVILGVGGYASGPVMIAAIILRPFMKTKLALFESNAYPGFTNRWLSRWVEHSFTNFEASTGFLNHSLVVGLPIRSGLVPQPRSEHKALRVLVFGGSQGARGINTTVVEAVKRGGLWLDGVEIVHQIGSRDFKSVDEQYKSINLRNVQWFEFLYDMPERYKWADLVVCRAGASTLAELAACQKAAVLIPFPFAADNHQQENADALAKQEAALMILQKDFTPEKFTEVVELFKNDRSQLKIFENRIAKFYIPQSAERISQIALENLR
jgi:UDP-N-acetylglucosamine--N-acetylmuramyl-(pentapeptide) pyrophosphoryl-undecaprenol N-acetylglucosamine transferase